MKPMYKKFELQSRGKIFTVSLAALFRATGEEGQLTSGPVPADVLDCLHLGITRPGVTGVVSIRRSEAGDIRYSVDGDVLTVYVSHLPWGISRVRVWTQYGTNTPECLIVDLDVPQGTPEGGEVDPSENIDMAAVSTFGGEGGADYKTDIYMDGAGRVIVERGEDGSTLLMDEHENPILKRKADGSTEYYDAYQSARLLIGTDGAVSINDPTAGTLAIAEAIMARATKHLLSWAGEGNPIKEGDKELTHADLYDMLMNTPAFVVLVYADHAYHPNLVTATQIAFTCSYASTNGDIVVERVTITSEDAVSSLRFSGVTRNAQGGVAIGTECVASGAHSFANGYGCKATGVASHAEGTATEATAQGAHAEGSSSQTRTLIASGENSHAEGLGCVASNKNSHAEGAETTASGYCSHAEGVGSVAYYIGHAEGNKTVANGYWGHAEGGFTMTSNASTAQHAQGTYNYVVGESNSFMHGCGTSETDRKNSVLYVGEEVYIFGVGGYDGTNHTAEGVQSLRQVLSAINLKLVNVPTA